MTKANTTKATATATKSAKASAAKAPKAPKVDVKVENKKAMMTYFKDGILSASLLATKKKQNAIVKVAEQFIVNIANNQAKLAGNPKVTGILILSDFRTAKFPKTLTEKTLKYYIGLLNRSFDVDCTADDVKAVLTFGAQKLWNVKK